MSSQPQCLLTLPWFFDVFQNPRKMPRDTPSHPNSSKMSSTFAGILHEFLQNDLEWAPFWSKRAPRNRNKFENHQKFIKNRQKNSEKNAPEMPLGNLLGKPPPGKRPRGHFWSPRVKIAYPSSALLEKSRFRVGRMHHDAVRNAHLPRENAISEAKCWKGMQF